MNHEEGINEIIESIRNKQNKYKEKYSGYNSYNESDGVCIDCGNYVLVENFQDVKHTKTLAGEILTFCVACSEGRDYIE